MQTIVFDVIEDRWAICPFCKKWAEIPSDYTIHPMIWCYECNSEAVLKISYGEEKNLDTDDAYLQNKIEELKKDRKNYKSKENYEHLLENMKIYCSNEIEYGEEYDNLEDEKRISGFYTAFLCRVKKISNFQIAAYKYVGKKEKFLENVEKLCQIRKYPGEPDEKEIKTAKTFFFERLDEKSEEEGIQCYIDLSEHEVYNICDANCPKSFSLDHGGIYLNLVCVDPDTNEEFHSSYWGD